MEVGHVDVRVLHRRVACADDPAFRAVLAARHGDLVGLTVHLVGRRHERAVAAEVAVGGVESPRAGLGDVRALVVELEVHRLVVVVRFEVLRVACGEGDVLREAVLAADGEDARLVRCAVVAVSGQEPEDIRVVVTVGDTCLQLARRVVNADAVMLCGVVGGAAPAELISAGDAQGGVVHVPAAAFDHELRLVAVGQDGA